jgi:hypothetical protein
MKSLITDNLPTATYCGDTENEVWFGGIIEMFDSTLKWHVWDHTTDRNSRILTIMVNEKLKNGISGG